MSEEAITRGQHRHQCFTIFGDIDINCDKLSKLVPEQAKYVCYQVEICPRTKREHIQGYIEFHNKVWWKTLINVIYPNEKGEGKSIRVNKCKGTPQQNRTYCSKDSDRKPGTEFHEYGEISGGQGKRNDLLAVKEKIDTHVAWSTIADEHFGAFIRYHKHFEAYAEARGIELIRVKRNWKTITIALTGVTNSGKTSAAYKLFPNLIKITKGNTGLWFGAYKQHQVVLFDEFGGHTTPHSNLLQLLDEYSHDVDCKGGSASWIPDVIILTSNVHPKDWYHHENKDVEDEMWRALERRIDMHIETFRTSDGGHKAVVHKAKIPEHNRLETQPRLQSDDYVCSLCDDKHKLGVTIEKTQLPKSNSRSDGVIIHPVTCPKESARDTIMRVIEETYFGLPMAAAAAPSGPPAEDVRTHDAEPAQQPDWDELSATTYRQLTESVKKVTDQPQTYFSQDDGCGGDLWMAYAHPHGDYDEQSSSSGGGGGGYVSEPAGHTPCTRIFPSGAAKRANSTSGKRKKTKLVLDEAECSDGSQDEPSCQDTDTDLSGWLVTNE